MAVRCRRDKAKLIWRIPSLAFPNLARDKTNMTAYLVAIGVAGGVEPTRIAQSLA
jgi:hypothetical protein